VQNLGRDYTVKYSKEAHSKFKEEMASVPADMMVWIDEIGMDSRDRHYCCGYHMLGMTPTSHTLNIRGKRILAITALSTCGI